MKKLFWYRVGAAFVMYISLYLAIHAVYMDNILILVISFCASVIAYASLVRHVYKNRNFVSPILVSLSGFFFGSTSLVMVSYFFGNEVLDVKFVDFQSLLSLVM